MKEPNDEEKVETEISETLKEEDADTTREEDTNPLEEEHDHTADFGLGSSV